MCKNQSGAQKAVIVLDTSILSLVFRRRHRDEDDLPSVIALRKWSKSNVKNLVFGGLFLLLSLSAVPAWSAEAEAPVAPTKSALKNPAVDWESLPLLRTGVKVWSHTSKNPLNFTVMDWTNYTLQDADGYEQALFKGQSGMLIHAWYDPSFAVGNLKLYLKDAKTPDYNLALKNYFNSQTYPHWLWWNQGNMLWAFPCLPFESAFKATVTKRPQWYQYTLHLYREDRFSENLSRKELETLRTKIQQPVGTFPGANSGNQTESNAKEIGGQETGILFDSKTAGVVRSIKIEPPSLVGEILDHCFIRMTTDGAVTADVPMSMFFGGYKGVVMRNAKGMPAGCDGKKLYCYFPMPFWKSMKIELINKTPNSLQMKCDIGWSDQNLYPQESTGIFKVKFNDTMHVKAGEPDFANLDVEGSGVLVGCVSRLTGDIEANFSIFSDGSKTPRVETTGGEDYFNHSYGIHPGFSTAFSGGLADRTGYRFHIIDYIPFLNSLRLTQDHALHFTHDRAGDFFSAVFYYHNPKKILVQTDSLDVGNQEAEAAHQYQIAGSEKRVRVQKDTASYEGAYDEPITDEGRWTDKESSFVVAIQPNNDGVRIRKRINQTAYHQEIDVYVDGVKAGVWFEQGTNYVLNYSHRGYRDILEKAYAKKGEKVPSWQNGKIPAKFRDTEFEIPASLTSGKKELRIRMVTKGSLAVTPADAGLTNEYYYWIYAYAKDR
ncbi:MAG: DUF2961 domain-containing protein [Planctomycetota bacterium]